MAAPSKKTGPLPEDIMSSAEMKPLLTLSKREPVNAAIGLTADKLGVILLHKKMKPRKVLTTLRAEAKKLQLNLEAPSFRFGTAEVDTEIDSSLVRFRINKEAPGMLGTKLREHLKKAGFTKVEFIVDPSLEEEGEDEDEDAAPAASTQGQTELQTEPNPGSKPGPEDWPALVAQLSTLARSIAGSGARQPLLVQLATAANASLKARQDFTAATAAVEALRQAVQEPGDAAAPAAAPDAAALGADLAALMRRIAGAAGTDATLKARLVTLATGANTRLKSADLAGTADLLEQLRQAVNVATDVPADPPVQLVDGVPIPWGEASNAWASARAAAKAAALPIVKELGLLAPGTADGIENVLDSYGGEMADTIKSAGFTDAVAGLALIGSTIAALRSEMATDQLFTYLDGNGLPVRPAFLDGLNQVESVLRPASAA